MPAFIAALLGGLLSIAASLAGRVLLSLGFGIVSYTGLTITLDWLRDQALNALNATGADVVGLLSYMKVGVSLNIIISALLARLVLQGLTSGTIKRMVLQ